MCATLLGFFVLIQTGSEMQTQILEPVWCDNLNEMSPINLGHLNTWSPVGELLGRIGECGLAGRSMSPE